MDQKLVFCFIDCTSVQWEGEDADHLITGAAQDKVITGFLLKMKTREKYPR